jgi:NAD+ kinase
MNNFFVIGNKEKPNIKITSLKIRDFLESHNKKCGVVWGYVKNQDVPKDTQCIIVLGGDGTLLQASRELHGIGAVFIGVNFGHLGFLSEVEKEDIDETLLRLINDDFSVENRMMLEGSIIRGEDVIAKDVALNDIVLNRSGVLRIMHFSIYVNGLKLNDYKADGMIISTPTGSTAYNMSAGGPIVKPSASLTVMTPICPHTLNTRSIILDGEDIIEIIIHKSRNNSDEIRNVYFDGDRSILLEDNDRIIITKSKLNTSIVKLSSKSFLQILGKKMNSNEGSQT